MYDPDETGLEFMEWFIPAVAFIWIGGAVALLVAVAIGNTMI